MTREGPAGRPSRDSGPTAERIAASRDARGDAHANRLDAAPHFGCQSSAPIRLIADALGRAHHALPTSITIGIKDAAATVIAETAGVELMWGCMDESVVSISAALHAAFSSPATRYLDLDGSLDLARDVADGGFILEDGVMRTRDAPGLGVCPRG